MPLLIYLIRPSILNQMFRQVVALAYRIFGTGRICPTRAAALTQYSLFVSPMVHSVHICILVFCFDWVLV